MKPLVDNHVKPILGIRRGERGVAAVALLFAVALNALLIYKYFGILTPGGTQGYYSIFMKRFQVSGFDASHVRTSISTRSAIRSFSPSSGPSIGLTNGS